jgi:hypothetical protein
MISRNEAPLNEGRGQDSPAEVAFLEAAITTLIQRVGEVAAIDDADSLPQINMGGLPKP